MWIDKIIDFGYMPYIRKLYFSTKLRICEFQKFRLVFAEQLTAVIPFKNTGANPFS